MYKHKLVRVCATVGLFGSIPTTTAIKSKETMRRLDDDDDDESWQTKKAKGPILASVSVCVVSHVVLMWPGFTLLGHASWQAHFEPRDFLGVVIVVLSLCVAVASSVVMWGTLLRAANITRARRAVYAFLFTLQSFGLATWALIFQFKPGIEEDIVNPGMDPLSHFFAFIIMSVYAPFGCLHFYRFLGPTLAACCKSNESVANRAAGEEDLSFLGESLLSVEQKSNSSARQQQQDNTTDLFFDKDTFRNERTCWRKCSERIGPLAVLLGLLIPVCLLLISLLPPIWNVPLFYYFPFQSPDTTHTILLPWLYDSEQECLDANGPDSDPLKCFYNLKIYDDVVVFYSMFYVFALLSFCVHSSMSLRAWVKTQSRVGDWVPQRVFGGPVQLSNGETVVGSFVICYFIWWIVFWLVVYPTPDNERFQYEGTGWSAAARMLGHMCNMFLVFLAFPVARNGGLFQTLWGVSWEASIGYHRFFGWCFFWGLIGHALMWYIDWAIAGVLWYNMTSVKLNLKAAGAPDEHEDNFTVPLCEIALVCVLVMGFFNREVMRRKYFEWFYYIHHLFLVVFVVSLVHAWTLWYFAVVPFLLMLQDRLVRFDQGSYDMSRQFTIVKAEANPKWKNGVTKLVLKPSQASQRLFSFRAGQYCMLHVPSINAMQWHPFTISSSPSDPLLSFHIKNMGDQSKTEEDKEQFTSQLFHRALDNARGVSGVPRLLHERAVVCGPYGAPGVDMNKQKVVVLVCGGIGVTPMHSMLRHLYQRCQSHKSNSSTELHLVPGTTIEEVHFVWTVRKREEFDMLHDTLSHLAVKDVQTMGKLFSLHLFATREQAREEKNNDGRSRRFTTSANVPYECGRPDLRVALRDLLRRVKDAHVQNLASGPEEEAPLNEDEAFLKQLLSRPNYHAADIGVFACGPHSLCESAHQLARDTGFLYHEETFLF